MILLKAFLLEALFMSKCFWKVFIQKLCFSKLFSLLEVCFLEALKDLSLRCQALGDLKYDSYNCSYIAHFKGLLGVM